jgi:uncharacterized tellurite resistance protein B-like protein
VVLESVRRFFQERVAVPAGAAASEPREQALRLAAAALLFEVVRADAHVQPEERTVIDAKIRARSRTGSG